MCFSIFAQRSTFKNCVSVFELRRVRLDHADFSDRTSHDNFNGILCADSTFNDSDLYNSRFVLATLKNSTFQNCNLKKTMFYQTIRELVSFKSSNTREALFMKGDSPE